MKKLKFDSKTSRAFLLALSCIIFAIDSTTLFTTILWSVLIFVWGVIAIGEMLILNGVWKDDETKTLLECKDEVASKHDLGNWMDVMCDIDNHKIDSALVDTLTDEAMELYLEQNKN